MKQMVNFKISLPLDGTPVPILYQEKVSATVIQCSESVYIGSNEGIGQGQGILITGEQTIGFGAADFGLQNDQLINLYACVANPREDPDRFAFVRGFKVV